MDLKSMKRRELQALCKEHGIRANATNSRMIDSLSSILQEKMKRKGCLKGSGDSAVDSGIVRGGSKKVTFEFKDEDEDGDKEYLMNPVGKSKRKSIRRRSSIAPKGSEESPMNVVEVPRRATRSRGLAESVLWSPVIEKKKKNGTEGVRQNAKPSMGKEEKASVAEVPLTRSLRNRVVVVGADDESVTGRYTRNTQKRKNSDKKEQKENMAASLKEDVAVGKENTRKRSREGVFVEDEPPPRRPTRSQAKFEETVATEEVDISRPNKRRKRGMDVLPVEEVVGKEIERVLKPGGSTKRSRGNTSDSDAMGSGDVTGHTRRSTRSTSALLEAGTYVFTVGKFDQEGKAVRKNKSENRAKGDSGSLLSGSEVVAAPVRRSTRGSSTLKEDASLPVGGKSIKGKSQKLLTRLPASVVVAVPARRSTRGSSVSQEEKTSAISVGESGDGVEVVGKSRSQKQTKEHGLKRGVSKISSPIAEAVADPTRRSTRHSSNLVEDVISLPVVRKSTKGGETVKHGKSQKHVKDHGSMGGGSTPSLVDSEVIVEHARSPMQSSSLLEDMTSPAVGKSVKDGKARMKGRPRKQRKDHASDGEVSLASLSDSEAIGEPEKKLTRSSSKMSEDDPNSLAVGKLGGSDKGIRNSKPGKHKGDRSIEKGGSAALLADSVTVTTPTRRSTRGHSDAVLKDNSSKKRKAHIIEQGDSTASLLDNEAIATPGRRSTRHSSKVDEVLRSPSSLLLDKEAVITTANRWTRQASKVRAGSEVLKSPLSSHGDNEAALISPRRSTHRSLKSPSDSESLKSPCSLRLDDKAVTTPARRATRHSSKVPTEGEVQKSPCSSHPDNEASITPDRRLALDSLKVPADSDDLRSPYSSHPDNYTAITPATRLTCHLSKGPAESEVLKSPRSLDPASGLLEDIKEDAHVKAKSLCVEHTYVQEGQIEMNRTFIEGTDTAGQISLPGHLDTPLPEVSHDVDPENASQMRHSPESVPREKIEYDTSYSGTRKDVDDMSLSSHITKGHSSFMQVENRGRGESPINIVECSSVVQEEFSGKLACSNVDATVEAGTLESYGNDTDATADPVDITPSTINNKKASKEHSLDLEICGASKVGLQGDEAKYIGRPALVGKSSDELLPASASTEIDPEEPELKVEVECPREDFRIGSGVDKILVTSNTEVCLETCYHISNEESDSKVEAHIGNKVQMDGTEVENTASSPVSCKSAGVLSPTFTLHTEISPEIDIREPDLSVHAMSKVASDIGVSLVETSGTHSKTLEVSMTAERDPGSLSDIQRSSEDEVENCEVDTDTILSAQLVPEESDAGEKIEASVSGSESQSCIGVEIIKKTWASSTLSITVNDGAETEGDKSGAEKNEDELRSSSPSDNPTCDPDSGGHMNQGGSPSSTAQLTPEGSDAGKKIEASISSSKTRSCIGVDVSSTAFVMVNDDAATVGNKSSAEKNEDELRPSSPSENPTCDLDSGGLMNEGSSPSSTAQLAHVESDAGRKIEASIASSETRSCIGVEVIKETWVSSTSSVMVNNDSATEGNKSNAEKNGDELMPSSLSENPACDLDTGDHMKGGGSSSSNAQLAPEECDVGEKIDASVAGNELQSGIDVEVIRETWVSSTSAVTVNDDTEPEGDTSGAEKNGDERRSSSPSEHPLCDLDTGFHMKERGSSTTEDNVDDSSTRYSHGDSKRSDFTVSLCDKDQADAEGNLTDSSDEKFCEDSDNHFRSLDAFIIPDGPSYVLPVASKDGESTPSLIATTSSKAIDGKSFVDHGSSIHTLASSCKFVKQLEKEEGVLVVDVGSAEISALATENRSPMDAVLFKSDTKAGDLHVLPMSVTCEEEILPITSSETPATVGYTSSVNKGDIQELPCVPDRESGRLMSDGKEVAFCMKDSLGVDSVDRSPKLTFKGHEALEQLNEVAAILPETVHTANALADVDHESLELGATVEEEMENIDSFERNASIKGEDATLVKKTDSIGRSTSDHVDELCEKQDEAFLLQSGELHPGDVASHSALDNSASTQGDERVSSSPDNCVSATDMENVPSSPKMDVLSDEDHLTKCNTEKASVEEETRNMKVFPSSASSVPLADQKESPDTLECFEHASDAEEGVAHGAMPMPAEDLFCMDNEAANCVNDGAQLGQSGHHEENIGHGKCGDFLKINITSSIAIGDGEMEAVVSSGSSVSHEKEDCPYNREISPVAENLSGSYAKPCSGMDAQDIQFADQYDDQEERRTSIQESLEVSKFRKEEIFTVLDVTRIEGSPTRMSQIERFETTLTPTVAEQEELTARKCTELSDTVADQAVFWDCKESSAMEGRPIGNELDDPESSVTCTAQHAAASLDTGAYGINSEATHENIVNKSGMISPEDCFEDFLEISTAKSREIGEGAMKAVTLSGSFDAMSEEASPDDCQTPPKADNLPSVYANHSADLDSQVDQSEDKEEWRSLMETSEISKFWKEETVVKIEGSPTVMFKSEKTEVALIPTVAKQGELIAGNHTELYATNVADQGVSWNYGENSVMDRRHIGHELGDHEFRGACTAQHALASLDAGDVGVSRAATQDSIVDKDETMAPEEYYEDFWSFPDDCSQYEARVVDSQIATESIVDKAGHSSKSANDVREEQNWSSDLKQAEDSEECVHSTPTQLTRNFEPCSVIDDAIRNKENTVGLKMGSVQKQNEKSAISTSSRRPLQSVLRTKSEH